MTMEGVVVKILIVEDWEQIQNTICEILTLVAVNEETDPPEPPILVTAQSGEEGLRKLLEEEFDLLITDVDMGDMNGITMIKKAREQGRVPEHIFLITAQDFEQEALDELGVTRYFKKPYILVEEIKEAIGSLKKS